MNPENEDDSAWSECEGVMECSAAIAAMPFELAGDAIDAGQENLSAVLETAENLAGTASETAVQIAPTASDMFKSVAEDVTDSAATSMWAFVTSSTSAMVILGLIAAGAAYVAYSGGASALGKAFK